MFYSSNKIFDWLDCFADHKSPPLEGCCNREPSFLHLQDKIWNLHSFSVKNAPYLLGKTQVSNRILACFLNYIAFILVCIRLPLTGPADFDFISYVDNKRGKLRWLIIKDWHFDLWR